MRKPFGPAQRPDAAPLHDNVIRRFREELRLDRKEFAELLDVNIDTLRVWESGSSKPRGPAALKITTVAENNHYPLTIDNIFDQPRVRKKPNGKA